MQTSTWALIADIYTPLLLALAVYLLMGRAKSQQRGFWLCAKPLIYSTIYLYVMRFVDIALDIWPSFGSDYSTHTAVALVLVVQIWMLNLKLGVLSAFSLLAYMQLMNFLDYHTYLDMVSTSLFLLPVFVLIWRNQKG
ncbi:hypothetical protein JCM19231_4103 [Vibrio ishigakensis]|uniref:Uncharacterized protein n=1 Tax=Vibrio ishigakensis TaxID=1481914 RepID=A0A0B8P949_9VIBR|nr:hypothetical protein [Vibrio ishigakensis]GAM59743.1 hypothetical protein JCM19231_4103 [Vibrio ishigakensis]